MPFVFMWVDFHKCQAARRFLHRCRAELDETPQEIPASSSTVGPQAQALYRKQFL